MLIERIEKFEDIEAWQIARELTREIYRVTNRGAFVRDFGLRDQIHCAAVYIMSNIAEGFERGSNREFTQFLFTAKGSAGEVRSQLYIALDQGYINQNTFAPLFQQTFVVSRMISCLALYLS